MYWPKFIGKAETKRNRLNLKNRSRFSKLYGPTMVRTVPAFSHTAVLEAKKTAKLRGSRFFRLDRTVWSEFQNHGWGLISGFFFKKKNVKLTFFLI